MGKNFTIFNIIHFQERLHRENHINHKNLNIQKALLYLINSACIAVTCWPDEFKCDDYCWNKIYICDGEEDCSDGSDERGCVTTSTTSIITTPTSQLA